MNGRTIVPWYLCGLKVDIGCRIPETCGVHNHVTCVRLRAIMCPVGMGRVSAGGVIQPWWCASRDSPWGGGNLVCLLSKGPMTQGSSLDCSTLGMGQLQEVIWTSM